MTIFWMEYCLSLDYVVSSWRIYITIFDEEIEMEKEIAVICSRGLGARDYYPWEWKRVYEELFQEYQQAICMYGIIQNAMRSTRR